VRKSGGSGTSLVASFLDNSGGTLDAEVGTLKLAVGSVSPSSIFTGGTDHAAAGATLDLTGGTVVEVTGSLTGGAGGGTVLLAGGGPSAIGNGATLNFPAGLFQSTGGTLDGGSGGLTNAGALSLAGGSLKAIAGDVTNQGTMTQTDSGNLDLGDGTLTNQAGALYDLQSDAGLVSGTGIFVNEGTVQKSNGSGASGLESFFSNPGTVVALSGALAIDFNTTDVSGRTLTSGTWELFNGATLEINDAVSLTTNNATVVLGGPGVTFVNLAELTVNGGRLTIQDGGTFTTTGDFTNRGYLLVDASSVLTASGSFTQGSTATLEIQLGGVGQNGQVKIAGNANLDGTLTPVNGYAPSTGEAFTILTFTSRNGTDFPNPPAGFDEVFDDGNGSLTVVAQ
jgi:hypothetical protein